MLTKHSQSPKQFLNSNHIFNKGTNVSFAGEPHPSFRTCPRIWKKQLIAGSGQLAVKNSLAANCPLRTAYCFQNLTEMPPRRERRAASTEMKVSPSSVVV